MIHANPDETRIRSLIERLWNHRDLDALDELCWPQVVVRLPQGTRLSGIQAYRAYILDVLESYPDLHVRIHELTAVGDHLALRYTWTGSFAGGQTLMGPAAAGTKVIVEGVGLYHLVGGRVLVGTASEDWLSMYQQLGLVSPCVKGRAYA